MELLIISFLIVLIGYGIVALIQLLTGLFVAMTTFVLAVFGGAIVVSMAWTALKGIRHEWKMQEIEAIEFERFFHSHKTLHHGHRNSQPRRTAPRQLPAPARQLTHEPRNTPKKKKKSAPQGKTTPKPNTPSKKKKAANQKNNPNANTPNKKKNPGKGTNTPKPNNPPKKKKAANQKNKSNPNTPNKKQNPGKGTNTPKQNNASKKKIIGTTRRETIEIQGPEFEIRITQTPTNGDAQFHEKIYAFHIKKNVR